MRRVGDLYGGWPGCRHLLSCGACGEDLNRRFRRFAQIVFGFAAMPRSGELERIAPLSNGRHARQRQSRSNGLNNRCAQDSAPCNDNAIECSFEKARGTVVSTKAPEAMVPARWPVDTARRFATSPAYHRQSARICEICGSIPIAGAIRGSGCGHNACAARTSRRCRRGASGPSSCM